MYSNSSELVGDLSYITSGFAAFKAKAAQGNLVPIFERLFSDQLTPVTAYGCLVKEDDREAPSFLLESVVNGDQSVRHVTSLLYHKW